ncbi:MAG: Rpn family recombination-promoting nuclease/putative transposase, partial [Treponema sp.]|nr:Rpn family recombination-promoting nuclease/putative transposase [Treponema sp.]
MTRDSAEEQTRKGFRLPVIIPLVLYNGLEPWTVAPDFAEICADSGLFGEYALNFKYYLIDVHRLQAE